MTWVLCDWDEWYPVYEMHDEVCDPGAQGAYALDDALIARYRAAYAEFTEVLQLAHDAIEAQRSPRARKARANG